MNVFAAMWMTKCQCGLLPNYFGQLFIHVTSGYGLVIVFWQYCSTLCTFISEDDAMFSCNGANGPESKTTCDFVQCARWRHWVGRSLPSPTACFLSHPADSPHCLGDTVMQWAERWTCDQQVVGSNLTQSCVTTLGKLFTSMCLCYQALLTWHWPRGGDALLLAWRKVISL